MQTTAKTPNISRKTIYKTRRFGTRQAWLWLAPTLLLEITFFIYPLLTTFCLSFYNKDSTIFVGLRNYQRVFSEPDLLEVLRNNLLWLVLGTLLAVGLGLALAALTDRIKVERVVKSALFVPMAISFVAVGVIWRLVYIYEPSNRSQIGLLNAFIGLFGTSPQAWLVDTRYNNLALIAVFIWTWTGFCMVIISAALKGVPDELIEAAKIDGAGRFTQFWHITVPMIKPTLAVITTTMAISILKIFDIVYVMTGGNFHTGVIALNFYYQLFDFNDYGEASALAIVLLLTSIPIIFLNVLRVRQEESIQ